MACTDFYSLFNSGIALLYTGFGQGVSESPQKIDCLKELFVASLGTLDLQSTVLNLNTALQSK